MESVSSRALRAAWLMSTPPPIYLVVTDPTTVTVSNASQTRQTDSHRVSTSNDRFIQDAGIDMGWVNP